MSAKAAITPVSLGRPKVKLSAPAGTYSHKTQTSGLSSSLITAITWNSTQTFDTKGQPRDRDKDN